MAATVHQLVPRNERKTVAVVALLTDAIMAERLHLVDQAQLTVDEAWDRVMMSADGGEPDQMAVLDYEMALNELLEANIKAGLAG